MIDILFDWMTEVTVKFKFQSETFFIAVNLVYRYLSLHQCTREKLQLLGVTALFSAAKYEEIYPPHLKEYLSLCENSYMKTEMINIEAKIVCALEFKLAIPTALHFLTWYTHVAGLSKREHHFACLVLEMAVCSPSIALKYKDSRKAAASVYLANKVFTKVPEWPQKLQDATELNLFEVQPCAKDMFVLLYSCFGQQANDKDQQSSSQENSRFSALKQKYSSTRFYEVGRLRFDWKSEKQSS